MYNKWLDLLQYIHATMSRVGRRAAWHQPPACLHYTYYTFVTNNILYYLLLRLRTLQSMCICLHRYKKFLAYLSLGVNVIPLWIRSYETFNRRDIPRYLACGVSYFIES